ncbi:RNA polymerase sigma factor SigJ [Agromyces sp. LHK192]|uniref:RNA polymerase sigma factor SigJ n=1 Tax=Agromyces sp. LHK192 TaxID=2498704 RepID=UPI000FD76285|nr:RNA polymerase sigma factor SigJ [Agromyces sp. LHK192]
MTPADPDASDPGASDPVDAERGRLLGLAYRMLGSTADAEDAVQETYLRWYRMPQAERDGVDNVAAWLTTAASRVCLDVLGSARARRERYVGEWLPEPIPESAAGTFGYSVGARAGAGRGDDPLERAALDESVSAAVLVLLESLSPAERVAFVLHDVFAVPFDEIAEAVGRTPAASRQLASSARRHVREGRRRAASREEHDGVVRAFLAAAAGGSIDLLVGLLDPAVELHGDGGGLATAVRRPVLGPDHVSRFLAGTVAKRPGMTVDLRGTADGLALVAAEGGVVDTVMVFEVEDGRITRIWTMRNPAKLRLWNA